MLKLNIFFFTVFVGIVLTCSKGVALLPEPFIERPNLPDKEKIERKINSYNKKHKDVSLDAEQLYYLSALYIADDKLEKARQLLEEALTKNPKFIKAHIQLGFIFLWQNNITAAYASFSKVMQYEPCEKTTLVGLEQVALLLLKEEGKEQEAITIYRELIKCHPKNSDYLFYLGQLLARINQLNEAELVLKKSLKISPKNVDAAFALASIYIRENKWDQAEKIYSQHPNNEEAQIWLARISYRKKSEQLIELSKSHPKDIPYTSEELLELGLAYVEVGEWQKAQGYLEEAISINPNLSKAYVQLGIIYQKENNLIEAKDAFIQALQDIPCDKQSLFGLEQIALIWVKEEEMYWDAIDIYRELLICYPNNGDYLFWLGHLLVRTKQWDEAEIVLKRCLFLHPQNTDASFELAALYKLEKRWCEAKEIYYAYPNNVVAEEGLARIAHITGDYAEAEDRYRRLVSQNPNSENLRHDLARTLVAELKFREAKDEYVILTKHDPKNEIHWKDLFEIKRYTDPAIFVEAMYTEAKENDPTLKAPVVKDYYFNSGLHLLFSPFDPWQIDTKGIFYHQRENKIFGIKGVNYNVYIAGAQIVSHYEITKDWRWDVIARELRAWGEGQMIFPFDNTTRFEPGTSIVYSTDTQNFWAGAHYESFIIKNLTSLHSQLLRMGFIEADYGYRPDIYLHPEVEAWVAKISYHDSIHNREYLQNLWLRCKIPYTAELLTVIYLFEHSHFNKLTINYTSYKQRYRNTIGIRYHQDFWSKGALDILYEHRWQATYDLFQPIGDLVFIAAKQILIANRITAEVAYRVKDKVRVIMGGHYYRDTLPYRDFVIGGSILWEF